jgi:hypothetical protein
VWADHQLLDKSDPVRRSPATFVPRLGNMLDMEIGNFERI